MTTSATVASQLEIGLLGNKKYCKITAGSSAEIVEFVVFIMPLTLLQFCQDNNNSDYSNPTCVQKYPFFIMTVAYESLPCSNLFLVFNTIIITEEIKKCYKDLSKTIYF
jgi:hypothetical protein